MHLPRVFSRGGGLERHAVFSPAAFRELSRTPPFERYRVLSARDARRVLRDMAHREPDAFREVYRQFVSHQLTTHRFAHHDRMLEGLSRLLGHDMSPHGPPVGAALYVARELAPERKAPTREPPVPEPVIEEQARRPGPRSWVMYEFVCEQGKPVLGVRCDITPPGGQPRPLASNEDGIIYVADISAGECSLIVRSLDGSAWKPAEGPSAVLLNRGSARGFSAATGRSFASECRGTDWKATWDDGANESVRKARKTPLAMRPGDEVTLAKSQTHELLRPTDATHRIVVKRAPLTRVPFSD